MFNTGPRAEGLFPVDADRRGGLIGQLLLEAGRVKRSALRKANPSKDGDAKPPVYRPTPERNGDSATIAGLPQKMLSLETPC